MLLKLCAGIGFGTGLLFSHPLLQDAMQGKKAARAKVTQELALEEVAEITQKTVLPEEPQEPEVVRSVRELLLQDHRSKVQKRRSGALLPFEEPEQKLNVQERLLWSRNTKPKPGHYVLDPESGRIINWRVGLPKNRGGVSYFTPQGVPLRVTQGKVTYGAQDKPAIVYPPDPVQGRRRRAPTAPQRRSRIDRILGEEHRLIYGELQKIRKEIAELKAAIQRSTRRDKSSGAPSRARSSQAIGPARRSITALGGVPRTRVQGRSRAAYARERADRAATQSRTRTLARSKQARSRAKALSKANRTRAADLRKAAEKRRKASEPRTRRDLERRWRAPAPTSTSSQRWLKASPRSGTSKNPCESKKPKSRLAPKKAKRRINL